MSSINHRYLKQEIVPSGQGIAGTPSAAFTFTVDGLTVYFKNKSVSATSYSWDFDDGDTSTARNPIHTYEGPGPDVYTVTLQINGVAGPSIQHDVSIAAQAPDMDLHILDLTIDEVIGLSIDDVLGLKI